MFCPKCGKEIPSQATFCSKCGTSISGTARSAVPEEPPLSAREQSAKAGKEKRPKKKRGKKVLTTAVLIVAAIVLLPVLFGSPDDISSSQGDTAGSVSDSETELLAIMDNTHIFYEETIIKEVNEYLGDSEGLSNYLEHQEQILQACHDFLAELENLCQQAEALSGLDAKLETVRDEYFNMLRDSATACAEAERFLIDFYDLDTNVISYTPKWSDYGMPSEYAEAVSAWVQEAKTACESISCPSNVEFEWERYKSNLMYSEDIAEKMAMSNPEDQTIDWLRFLSARAMMERSNNTDEVLFDKFTDSIMNVLNHAVFQETHARALSDEVWNYVEMMPEEKEEYIFENIGYIELDYDVVDTIYPSLYETYDAFAIIKTSCTSGSRSIVVEAEIEGFTQKYVETFDLDAAYRAIYIKPPALTGELNLNTAKPAQLKITVSEKDGTLIEAKSFPITLKSKYDFEWYSSDYGISTKDNILCFLTPEAEAIVQLKRAAVDEIAAMTGGAVQSFVGYQSIFPSNYATTYIQVAGLMRALYDEMGVRYNMNPYSISGSDQHIQLPEDVIKNKSGLCIETSLVIASALQSAKMHAFLVFPPGHAQVAVEVWNRGEGFMEYFLIETTVLDSNNNRQFFVDQVNAILQENKAPSGIITYMNSNEWYDYLKDEVEHIVDCNDAQLLGMTPFAN